MSIIICAVNIRIKDCVEVIQAHAAECGESATAFINRAIEETMARDKEFLEKK